MTGLLKPKVKKVCACGEEFYTAYQHKTRCTRRCKIAAYQADIVHHYRQYGLTVDDYNRMFTEQDGCCAICKRHQIEFKKRLFVDHNHETGKVRGLLCKNCNFALGLFRDSPEILQVAKEYVS